MQLLHRELHYQQALSLYHKRVELLQQPLVLAEELALYTYRLQIHLTMLAQQPLIIPQQFTSPDEMFIVLVTDLLQKGTAHQAIINEYFVQEQYQSVIHDALVLYPPQDGAEFLLSLYYTAADLRPQLLKLWLAIQKKVPSNVLQQALKSSDNTLRQTAIDCIAILPEYSLTQTRAFYQDDNFDCQIAAWYAGVLQGDTKVIDMIAASPIAKYTPEQYQKLMHLCALLAHEEFLGLLKLYAITNPKVGFNYLALYGSPGVQTALLQGMNAITTLESAAKAWFYLTGYELAKRPRLNVVGSEQSSHEAIPDVNDAISWWETYGQAWDSQQRYFLGVALNTENMSNIRAEYAGEWINEMDYLTCWV